MAFLPKSIESRLGLMYEMIATAECSAAIQKYILCYYHYGAGWCILEMWGVVLATSNRCCALMWLK